MTSRQPAAAPPVAQAAESLLAAYPTQAAAGPVSGSSIVGPLSLFALHGYRFESIDEVELPSQEGAERFSWSYSTFSFATPLRISSPLFANLQSGLRRPTYTFGTTNSP